MNDESPDTIEVESGDILNESAEFWKNMAFEADRRVKELEVQNKSLRAENALVALQLNMTRNLAAKADDELAHYQRVRSEQCFTYPSPLAKAAIYIDNARAALCKSKELM
jgi:hypothetical protein